MSLMSWKREGTVAVLTLENGENRHNPDFVAAFLATMDAIEADAAVKSVVIASNDPKNWSLGIDLNWVIAAAQTPPRHPELKAFLYGLNSVFARVLTFPTPVVAAIGGHCFGNGAILACACDFRFMRSDRGFFCFPEVDVNIPFLPGMLSIVQRIFPAWYLDALYLSGRRAGGAELAEQHVVTGTAEGAEAVLAQAVAFAAGFEKGRGIFGEIKRRKHAPVLRVFETEDASIIEGLKLMA
jgi:enoyl-CoA hydratase/carnithine racemase